jgi:hypothetical protein
MRQFNGNTVLEKIEENESVTVIDGSLTVRGDIGKSANVTLSNSSQTTQTTHYTGTANAEAFAVPVRELVVQGNVHPLARINAASSTKLEFCGYLHNGVKVDTHNGHIHAQDLDEDVCLVTYLGNITTKNVGCNSTIKSYLGNITTENVERGSVVDSNTGSITTKNVGRNSTIRGHLGSITTENVERGSVVDSYRGSITTKNVGCNSTIKSPLGSITTENVGCDSTIKSHLGNITTENVERGSTIGSYSGSVSVLTVNANTVVESYSGEVSAFSRDPSATIKSHSGKCFINGVEQASERETNNRSLNASAAASSSRNIILKNLLEDWQAHIRERENKESFRDAFKRLQILPGNDFCCTITHLVPNIPVLLNGRLYDGNSLKQFFEASPQADRYRDPVTSVRVSLADVTPSRLMCTLLEKKIQEAEEAEAAKSLSFNLR